jgi:cytochrome b pre-mRNA-processing protein 3
MISSFFRKDPAREAAEALYVGLVDQSRRPAFYEGFCVEDSPEGRFELLALHMYLVLRRLKGLAEAREVSDRLVEVCFENLDDSLRELGIGDLQVGKKVRKMGEALYGRINASDAAEQDETALGEAVARNVFRSADRNRGAALANYLRRAGGALAEQSTGRLLTGVVKFPEPAESSAP